MAAVAGIVGAGVLAQAPEYSQQYLQRLGGAVDELRVVVEDFDRSADRAGLTREEALAELAGSQFLDNRNDDITRTVRRYERLSADLDRLNGAPPILQAALVPVHLDGDVARRALSDFEPGVPATPAGAGFAAAGFIAGRVAWAVAIAVGLFLWRRAWRARREDAGGV